RPPLVTPATSKGRDIGSETENKNTLSFLGRILVYLDRLGSLGTSGTPGRGNSSEVWSENTELGFPGL
ncbi:hypothetical protein LINGRAPRIM_LOCUS393, partial [Linum grandiflorum]